VYIDPENVENDILHDGLHGTCLSFSRILSGCTKPSSRLWRKQKRRKSKRRKRIKNGGHFCCAPGCTNSYVQTKLQGRTVSFYRFPSNPERRQQWVEAVSLRRGDDWHLRSWDRLCSVHFVGGIFLYICCINNCLLLVE